MRRRQAKESARTPIVPSVADIATFASIAAALGAFAAAAAGRLDGAGSLLLLAVLLDWLDGRIARKLDAARRFGMHLDSVADACAFGAVPAVIAILLTRGAWPVLASAIVFACAGAYRLARFQVRNAPGVFEGMPITANGVFVGGALLAVPPAAYVASFTMYFLIAAALMASRLRVRKV